MIKKNFASTLFHSRQRSSYALLALGLLLFYTFGIGVNSTPALADGIPGGNITNPVVRAVDIAKPAVVRILTTLGGRLTVHFSATQSADFPLGGGTYKLEVSGSGTFITSHGDILTADHVIKPPHDQSLDNFLFETAASDIANYINSHFSVTVPFNKNDVIAALETNAFPSATHYNQPTSEAYLSTDYTGPLNAIHLSDMVTGTHASIDNVEQESNFDQKDVAIVHINMDDTPSIPLADSSNIEQQDELTIIGFPGNGDVSQKNDPTQFLTSSINKIFVSALKQTDSGAPVIQVGGNIEHGDSGGPALDSHGNLVGVVSFGIDGGPPIGTSFLQASSSAQELIQILHLDTKPGRLQKAWNQAFTDYAIPTPGHWHQAQRDFQRLIASYSQFEALRPYYIYAQNQASHEQLPKPPQPPIDYTSVIIGIALVIGLFLLGLFMTRRKQMRSKAVAMAQPVPATVSSFNSTSAFPITPSFEAPPPPVTPWQQQDFPPPPPYLAGITEQQTQLEAAHRQLAEEEKTNLAMVQPLSTEESPINNVPVPPSIPPVDVPPPAVDQWQQNDFSLYPTQIVDQQTDPKITSLQPSEGEQTTSPSISEG